MKTSRQGPVVGATRSWIALCLVVCCAPAALADDPAEAVVFGLSGRVTHADTGAAITCAAVVLTPVDEGEPAAAATDLNGGYYFEPLPSGSYTVRAFAPGFATAELSGLAAGDTASQRDFALSPLTGPVLEGQVISEGTGFGIIAARVRLRLDDEVVGEAFACADGRYAISLAALAGSPGLAAFTLDTTARAHLPGTQAINLDPGIGATVDVFLTRSSTSAVPASLAGSVLGMEHDGTPPIPGAQVALRGALSFVVEMDPDGLYAIPLLQPGRYTLTATAPRHRSQAVQRTFVDFETAEVSFVLEPFPPADINGDGIVNAIDVQLIINAALGMSLPMAFLPDINGDGVVNAVDVQLVINAALGVGSKG